MDWNVTDEYFEWEVLKEWKQYTEKKKVNIFCSTYNVNARGPSSERNENGLKIMLLDSEMIKAFGDNTPDIYVLAFQEIVDLTNATSYLMESEVKLEWEQCVEKILGTTKYTKVASKSLVGLLLLVYAKVDITKYITDCLINTCAVGLFGAVGNKGGIGVHFKLYDSHLCFVSAHLAAQQNNIQGRNQDFWKISENLKFIRMDEQKDIISDESKINKDNTLKRDDDSGVDTVIGNSLEMIGHHDMIFWLGDMNYRLNFESIATVYELIQKKEWKMLLARDQMCLERMSKNAFAEFIEPEIAFPPTYKYLSHGTDYDRRPDKKVRMPAWCDRILWRRGKRPTGDLSDVKCLKYSSCQDLTMSDHRPVYSWLTFECNVFDREKLRKVKDVVRKRKDHQENAMIPAIRADNELSFPSIKYGEPSARVFTIANVGNVPVRYEFRSSPQSTTLPAWLRIDRPQGTIPIKEKVQVKIEILVNATCCKEIMEKHNRIEETILLEVGQDVLHFVTITADYTPSCFGQKIETLIRYKEPVRFMEMASVLQNDLDIDHRTKEDTSTDLSKDETGQVLSIPKELWRLVDHLFKYGMDAESIFITKGSASDISMIRECLDTGKEFEKCEIHSFGEALVRFLESLQDPVFPASLCANFDANMDITHYCRQALTTLPLSHYNTFIYVVSFLREVLKHSSRNRLTVDRLAYQFSCALTQSTVDVNGKLQGHKPFLLLRFFLTNSESL